MASGFSCIGGLVMCFCRRLIVLSRTGAIGINNAETDNDERYIRAYCSDADNSEHVWLYWMAGSSGAAFLLWLFGTFTIVVGVYLLTTLNRYMITTMILLTITCLVNFVLPSITLVTWKIKASPYKK